MNRHVCILMGSPCKQGNTQAILQPFTQRLTQLGMMCDVLWLYDKCIFGCTACRHCQTDWTAPHCVQDDHMNTIFRQVLDSELLVLATPIYAWYCTAPMKAALDRMVYALCKYYGDQKGPSLLAGKSVALLSTCGYRPEQGTDLWEAGIQRYCKHTGMHYLGMHTERHLGYHIPFMDEAKRVSAEAYAERIAQKLESIKERGSR